MRGVCVCENKGTSVGSISILGGNEGDLNAQH